MPPELLMFQHIFRFSPIATTLTDRSDGHYVDVNPAAERLLGYSHAELMAQHQAVWEAALSPGERQEMLQRFTDQGRVEGFPCTLTTRTGDSRDCLLSIESIAFEGQAYVLTQIVDVSAYRQNLLAPREAEAEVYRAQNLFRLLFHASPIPTALTSLPEHRFLDVNAAGEALLGYSRQEVIGQTTGVMPIAVAPEDYRQIDDLLLAQGQVRGREIRLRTSTGTEKTCLLSIETLQLEGRQYALTQLVDISAQKQVEQALREAQVIGNLGSWTADLRTGIFEASPESARLVGSTPGRHTFQELLSGIHPDDRSRVEQAWAATVQGTTLDIEHRMLLAGEMRWLRVKAVITHAQDGTPISAVGITQDITARKASEAVREQATTRLQLLVDASAAFAAAGMDEGALLDTLTQRTAEALGASCFIRLRHDDDLWLTVAAAYDPSPTIRETMEAIFGRTQIHIDAPHPAAEVVRSGQPHLTPVIDREALHMRLTPEVWPMLDRIPIQSELIAPLRIHGQTLGCLVLLRHTPGQPAFSADDLSLAQDLADRAGLALANARLYRNVQAAQQIAQRANAQLHALISSVPIGIGYLDHELRYQLVNPALAALNGLSPAMHLGQHLSAVVPGLTPQIEPLLRQALTTSTTVSNVELQGKARSATESPPSWLISYFPIPGPAGETAGVGVTVTDITVVRHTEAALQASMTRLHAALDSMTDAIYIADTTGRLIEFNQAFATYHRFRDKHACPTTLDDYPALVEFTLASGTFVPVDQQPLSRALRGETATNAEYTLRRTDTGETWVGSYNLAPIRDGDGAIVGGVVISRDITERAQVELRLRQSEARFATIFERSPIPMGIARLSDGQLTDVNAALVALFGRPRETIIGGTTRELEIWADIADRHRVQEQLLAQQRIANVESVARMASGEERPVLLSGEVVPINDEPHVLMQIIDISARKQAEEQLRQSEVRFRALIEHAPGALALVSAEGRFTFVSASTKRVLGYDPGDALGLDPAAITHPDDLPALLLLLNDLMSRPGSVATSHYRIRHQDGSWRWVESTISNLLSVPHVQALALNWQDISARKQAEQALLDLNQTLEERVRQRTAEVQDLYDHAPTGYHSLDAQGRVVMVNQTELSWLGYTREEMLGQPITAFFTPSSQATFQATFPIFIQQGWGRDLEFELVRKDGTIIPVLMNATAIYDAAGRYLMSRSTVFDHTERKQAEVALRESEAQNRLLFEESPEAVALIDRQGRIVRANRAYAQLVGYPLERLREQTVDTLELLSPAQLKQLIADVRPALKNETGYAETIVTLRRANGDLRVVEMRVFALTIHGQWHYLVSTRDITRERQTEDTLRQANAELAQAVRAKDEFLAMMSHELRTPLNAILSYSENLQDAIYDPLTPRQQRAIAAVQDAGRHLLDLINDILDLAKVEAGRMDLQIQQVSLHGICQASLVFVREQALKKRLNLEFHLNDPQATIEVDPTRLKQMLVNLLANAVKFTPDAGRVGLDVSVDGVARVVRFVVEDTGIGIAPADLARLFQPFSQLDSALNRTHAGTGLGLALVRRLAELHGGSVTVESTIKQGSRFTITLPYQPAPVEPSRETKNLSGSLADATPGGMRERPRARILLAEDNEANIGALSDYLSAYDYAVVVARNGHEALARADEAQPQMILMDIQMPGIDGLTAIRLLREKPTHAATPIIALTALAMPDDKERCLTAGATAYMTKPVSLRALVELIQQLLEMNRSL